MNKPKLYYPIKPFDITQDFGTGGHYYQSNGINIKGHNGIDIRAFHGQPVYASHDGVAYYEVDNKGGHGVVINGDGFKTVNWHFCDPIKEPHLKSPITRPTKVKAGDLIGFADNTGLSTGNHLHWAFKYIDKRGNTINNENGYYGAVDQTPYYNGLYAEDINRELEPAEYGDRNENVKRIQQKLIDLGFSIPDGATGLYGKQTKSAVYAFQLKRVTLSPYEKNIMKGSVVGPKTLRALQRA